MPDHSEKIAKLNDGKSKSVYSFNSEFTSNYEPMDKTQGDNTGPLNLPHD